MLNQLEKNSTKDIIEGLKQLNLDFAALVDFDFCTSQSRYFTTTKILSELCVRIDRAESLGISKDEISGLLKETREAMGSSRYMHRIQNWPRGYQGDFETVEMMSAGVTKNELSSLADCVEFYAQTLPITQQHRNKLVRQESLLRACIASNGNVLSVGCGGGIDVANALQHVSPSQYTGQLSFIDMDQGAIDLVKARTAGFSGKYSTRNVVREAALVDDDTFDLVLCGGIFDYFDKKAATFLLTNLLRSLKPSGLLFFTNIAANNPYRIHMEYFCDWALIERTEADIGSLLADHVDESDIEIERDSTGLALLVSVRRR